MLFGLTDAELAGEELGEEEVADIVAQLAYQPAILGNADEFDRRHDASLGMALAQQGFHPSAAVDAAIARKPTTA